MELSRLLNDPRPPKRPRLFALPPGHSLDYSDGSNATAQQCSKVHLPVDMVAYVMTFVDASERPSCRLVSQTWYAAYNRYHRYVSFSQPEYMGVSPRQLISTFHSHGSRLRFLYIINVSLAELVRFDPNLSTRVIPNVTMAFIEIVDPTVPNKNWLYDACHGWKRLQILTIYGYNFEPSTEFVDGLNRLLCETTQLHMLELHELSIRPAAFPNRLLFETEPRYAATLAKLSTLYLSLEHFATSAEVLSLLDSLKSVTSLKFEDINDLRVLDAVAGIVEQPDFAGKLKEFGVTSGLDLTRTPAVTIQDTVVVDNQPNNDDGDADNAAAAAEQRTVTRTRNVNVVDTMNRFRDLNYPNMEFELGFVLAASSCSTAHPRYHQFIDTERQFLSEFGAKCIPKLYTLRITHYTPSLPGYYWPLDALFCDENASFPQLRQLLLHLPPQAWFKSRLARILNNRQLLPKLNLIRLIFDDSADINVKAFVKEEVDTRDGAVTIRCMSENVIDVDRDQIENGTFDWNSIHQMIAEIDAEMEAEADAQEDSDDYSDDYSEKEEEEDDDGDCCSD
ncbi:hypothetical protein GQ42DRAFT_171125 [Ramicandelaber brevisporus]|nr:hypothetical protein GQ42DRAFT_171125 [Ramicandelaber brevisporus]